MIKLRATHIARCYSFYSMETIFKTLILPLSRKPRSLLKIINRLMMVQLQLVKYPLMYVGKCWNITNYCRNRIYWRHFNKFSRCEYIIKVKVLSLFD